MEQIPCAICGNLFTKNRRVKTCSQECKEEFRSRYARKRRTGCEIRSEINCVICGKQFTPIRAQKTCSQDCVKERKLKYKRDNNHKWMSSRLDYNKKWREENPEKYREQTKNYRLRHPDVEANRIIRNRFGMEPDGEHVELYATRYLISHYIRKAGE